MCSRGPEFADRDVSATIVEILTEHGHDARTYSRRPPAHRDSNAPEGG
jgi:hypothetical protein